MSLRKIDAWCPDCKKTHPIEVEVTDPPPQEIIRIVAQGDSARVDKLNADLAESQRTVGALTDEVQRWQSGENHLQAADMLRMLQTCPNCKPTWDVAVKAKREQAVKSLTPDQVKDIARAQKWWPPPPIVLP